jgi:nickel superoxide dismutase
MKTYIKLFSPIVLLILMANMAYAHCQVPCGIYGDQMRFEMFREHIATLEKSMNKYHELSENPGDNVNQLVRWVNNKDHHADEFTNIVTYYFLAQRIKIKDSQNKTEFSDYQKEITLLHQMMVFSMKSKQTTDLKNVEQLKSLVDQFENIYFSAEEKKHLKDHQKK